MKKKGLLAKHLIDKTRSLGGDLEPTRWLRETPTPKDFAAIATSNRSEITSVQVRIMVFSFFFPLKLSFLCFLFCRFENRYH